MSSTASAAKLAGHGRAARVGRIVHASNSTGQLLAPADVTDIHMLARHVEQAVQHVSDPETVQSTSCQAGHAVRLQKNRIDQPMKPESSTSHDLGNSYLPPDSFWQSTCADVLGQDCSCAAHWDAATPKAWPCQQHDGMLTLGPAEQQAP